MEFRILAWHLVHRSALAALLVACALPCAAQDASPPLDEHPWAKFPVGSWKTVQVIAETFDERGSVVNITSTETRTTLLAVTKDSHTLRVDVTVEVAGKRFPTQVQTVTRGYQGETPGQRTTHKVVGDSTVTINGQRIPVQQSEVTVAGEDFELTSLIHYAPDVPPYQLKRETTRTGTDGSKATTTVEVVALDMPQRVLGDIKTSAVVKTVRKHDKGDSVTIEVQCDDVPGGVVSHTSTERSADGILLRRSTLQLNDYSIGAGRVEEPNSAVRRRKYHRARRRGEVPAPMQR